MNKIKYLFSICFVAVFVFCMSVSVRAGESEIDTSVFEYRENGDGTIKIIDYTGTDQNVIIPSEIDGKAVKSIYYRAFNERSDLVSITISNGVTSIEVEAFYRCRNLKNITIPESVTNIGQCAFGECRSLTSITIPAGTADIGWGAFVGCGRLESINVKEGNLKYDSRGDCNAIIETESNTLIRGCNNTIIPDDVINIMDHAFDECEGLTSITIPDSVVSIGNWVFYKCVSIEKLIIPDSVISIGADAFTLCDGNCIPIYGNPDAYIKTYCDTCYETYRRIKFSCINHVNSVKVAEIPATCTQDGYTAGDRCVDCGTILSGHEVIPSLGHMCEGKIIIEATVMSNGIKEYVCIKCGRENRTEWIPKAAVPKKNEIISDLKNDSYKVTKSGTKNGTVEFSISNSSNSSITVPSTVEIAGITYKVTAIAKNAFKNNKNLKKITINGNVTKINANAFSGCTNLKTIKIKSKNLKSVGKNAFKGIHPKAKVKVPSICLEKYKKLLAKKGQKSSVKITK